METKLATIKDSIITEDWAIEQMIGKPVTVMDIIAVDDISYGYCKYGMGGTVQNKMIPLKHLEFKPDAVEPVDVKIVDDQKDDVIETLGNTPVGIDIKRFAQKIEEPPEEHTKYEEPGIKSKPKSTKSKQSSQRSRSNNTNKGKHKTRPHSTNARK